MKERSSSNEKAISPSNLISEIRFELNKYNGARQEDCHEFLSDLIGLLHTKLNRPLGIVESPINSRVNSWLNWKSQNSSIIGDCFYGQLETRTSCKYLGFKFYP